MTMPAVPAPPRSMLARWRDSDLWYSFTRSR